MGLERRKKSGNILAGSKLNVPGQGVFNVKLQPQDTVSIKRGIGERTVKIIPEPVPVDVCYLSTQGYDPIIAENGDFLTFYCGQLYM